MYLYETHCHTFPVSKCGKADVRQTVDFYREAGYAGLFITNHFLDGNINIDRTLPFAEQLDFYFSDYHAGRDYGKETGLKVFLGVEASYQGTDFLIYNLPEEWYYRHEELLRDKKTVLLPQMIREGALVVQAHPYREAAYIDHIRLFPRSVQAVEIDNACRTDFENEMAARYAEAYGLCVFAGSDNHAAGKRPVLCGMASETPLLDEADFRDRVLAGTMTLFRKVRQESSGN